MRLQCERAILGFKARGRNIGEAQPTERKTPRQPAWSGVRDLPLAAAHLTTETMLRDLIRQPQAGTG